MSTRSILTPLLVAGALAIAAMPAPPAAAQSLTLTVPYRGAMSMQTVSTTIELDASSIAGGATISVEGASVPVAASGCVGNACANVGSTPAGDDILVRRISGTTRARLELTYLASFGANYCSYLGPTTDKVFNVVLTGFSFANPTNGYRITSFMAPSDASCDIAYARVPGPRPSVSGTTLVKQGRLPLNLVLVLDRSPSMDWTIPGSTDKRWDRLKDSVQLFTSVWDVVGAPPLPATVSSEGHADDRLGLIFFGGTASESPLDGGMFFKQRGMAASPWSGPIMTALGSGSFIGGTSIGAGTDDARTQLDTVDSVNGDTAIVLFTDGEQNTPPCILRQGETTSPTVKPYPGLPGVTYTDQCTVMTAAPASNLLTLNGSILARDVGPRGPIFTIGLGEGGMAASAQLLDEISEETAGRGRFPNDGPSMDTSFVDSLVDNLKGSTVSMLARTTGNLPAEGPSTPLEVEVDPSLTRVVFVLGWSGVGQEVALEIQRPDGTVVTPPLSETNATSQVAAVNLPDNGPDGTWSARVIRLGGSAGTIPYHLTAYGVESRLSARVTESPRTGTGEPIEIVAEVGWDDGALADLPKGAIQATIERPPENLGNILHQLLKLPQASALAAPASSFDDTTGGGDDTSSLIEDISPLMLKISQLAGSGDLLERTEPRPLPETVTLEDVGYGRYEGTFDGTRIGGKYRIRVTFDWDDERTGKIKRIHLAERQVPVRPAASDSQVDLIRNPDTAAVRVLITPQDGFGNLVGPGWENHFRVRVVGPGTAAPPADPDVTGTYAIDISGVPPGTDPEVSIEFDGVTLRDAPLSLLENPSGGTGGLASRFSLSLHGGQNDPKGDFWDGADGDLSWGLDLEYLFTRTWAVELFYGHEDFQCDGGVGVCAGGDDPTVDHLSLNGKAYFLTGTWRPFIGLGLGGYDFSPGPSGRFGGNLFAGFQANPWPHLALEATARYHRVDAQSKDADFLTYHFGLRYRF